jgi:hypothetical protein
MSHSHIKKPEALPQPIVWWKLALGSVIFVALVGALWAVVNWPRSFTSTYETADGKILMTREVVDRIAESVYGSKVIYGVEARVQYTANGQAQDRWLRISDGMPRETLALKLAARPTECLVYWPPNHPENAKCWLK